MLHSRRSFITSSAAALSAAPLSALASQSAGKSDASPNAILGLFKSLPGEISLKIYAPATDGRPEFLVESNASKMMFVGSAIKTFILAESLRQVDSPNVVQSITTEQLSLDASVWNLDSATFNPPNLIGKVSQRTALEAMIFTATIPALTCASSTPDRTRSAPLSHPPASKTR